MSTSLAKLLLVDDQACLREFISELLLSQFDIDIIEAGDTSEAISLLRSNSFAAIVSDLDMPAGGGLELLSFWENNPEVQGYFLIFTGSSAPPTIQERVAVINKPNFKELIAVLRDLEIFSAQRDDAF